MQAKAYVSSSPGKLGSLFALFYFEWGKDVVGWHIEARHLYFSAAFFMAERFYAERAPRLYRSVEDDVYGPWTTDYPPARGAIRSPVPEALLHELERMQSVFVEEWLFFRSDAGIDAELAAYREREWPVHEVNIKARRLPRLHKEGSIWLHATPGTDFNVVQLLRKYWRLQEKVPER